jgi:hypothetical protein
VLMLTAQEGCLVAINTAGPLNPVSEGRATAAESHVCLQPVEPAPPPASKPAEMLLF